MELSMHELAIWVKGLFLVIMVWLIEPAITAITGLTILSSNVREFFVETKEMISVFASLTIIVCTIIKSIRDRNK